MHPLRSGGGGQRQHIGTPGLHLHHIAHGFVEQGHIGGGGDHRRALLNERNGTVLQFAGGIRLGVDIGNFLQLQAALQRQGVVQVPSNEKHLIVSGQLSGGGLNVPGVGENFLHLMGERLNALHHGGIGFQIDGAHNVAEVQAQQVQHHHLGAVGLGGGHGNLRACPGVQHVVGLPCDGGANHIDDGEDAGAPLLGFPQCGHGVQRLAGLADDDCQITGADDGVTVPELGGQTHLHAAA